MSVDFLRVKYLYVLNSLAIHKFIIIGTMIPMEVSRYCTILEEADSNNRGYPTIPESYAHNSRNS